MGVLSLLLLLAVAGAVGGAALAAAAPAGSPQRSDLRRPDPALALVAGLVALHALLLVFDLAGVPWRRGPLALGAGALLAAALAAAAVRWRREAAVGGAELRTGWTRTLERRGWVQSFERPGWVRSFERPGWGGSVERPGWGDAVAAVALLVYAAAAWTRRITIPDFVYHWGIKAKRALLVGGIDVAFLADPLRLTDHPDYPNLVPGLYAAIGVVRGAFHERAALLVSVAFFAVALAGVRSTVRARADAAAGGAGLPHAAAQGTVAAVALVLAGFGIGYRMAGAADWPIVAALCLALPALVAGGPARPDALRLGLAAALAAASKIEGVPLAALLVAAGGWRLAEAWWGSEGGAGARFAGGGRAAADLARLVVPPLLVVVPWVALNLRHGLFAAENTGPLVASRVPVALAAAVESFLVPEWLGLPWLLLALPALLAFRATRVAAALLLVQGGGYAWVYLTSPVDTRFLVLSSLPRLLFHLVPPLLALLAVALFQSRGKAAVSNRPH